jgi:hypothetical protein
VAGPGDEHDSKRFKEVMDCIRVRCGRGRPRTKHMIRGVEGRILGGGV